MSIHLRIDPCRAHHAATHHRFPAHANGARPRKLDARHAASPDSRRSNGLDLKSGYPCEDLAAQRPLDDSHVSNDARTTNAVRTAKQLPLTRRQAVHAAVGKWSDWPRQQTLKSTVKWSRPIQTMGTLQVPVGTALSQVHLVMRVLRVPDNTKQQALGCRYARFAKVSKLLTSDLYSSMQQVHHPWNSGRVDTLRSETPDSEDASALICDYR